MFRMSMHWPWPVALSALMATAASAQPSAAPAPPADPTQAQAAVPRAVHSSALAGYRRHADPTPLAWKDANETVNRIGGWRAYAREVAAPSAPAASAPARKGPP